MDALLLVAHGSRRQQSNNEVTELAEKLRDSCHDEYKIVYSGFLELASPSIPEGIQNCINDGATRITILPYFLNSGRHVVKDVPDIVVAAKNRHPDTDFRVAPHLGASALMVELLVESAKSVSSE